MNNAIKNSNMRSTFRLMPYINRAKTRADGTTAVMLRITIDGKKTVMATGIYCQPDKWDTKKGVITSPAKDANALRDLIKRAESNYQTFVNEQGVASAELLKNSLNGTLLKTQTLIEMSEEEREKLKARCEAIRSIETYKGSLFVSSATVFRMIRFIYKKDVAREEDTHGSFRLFPYRPNWNIDVYNLEMVIRLAYTIDSGNSHKFRQFIMNRLMGKPMYENVCITIHMDDFSKK